MPLFLADLVPQSVRGARIVERREVRTAAQCRRGIVRETVEVLDLSTAGARVRALAPLHAGNVIWIKLPGIETREARVIWSRGRESGCEFARPLHPAVLDSLLAGQIAAMPR